MFEDALEIRLIEEETRRPSGNGRTRLVDVDQHFPVGVEPDVVVHRARNSRDVLDNFQRMEHALNFVVVADCSRKRIGGGPSLDDRHPVSIVAELPGKNLAGRPIANDDDVEFRHSLRLMGATDHSANSIPGTKKACVGGVPHKLIHGLARPMLLSQIRAS